MDLKTRSFPEKWWNIFTIEDNCTLSQSCAGRVMGVLEHVRDNVVKPPTQDLRNIMDLVE